MREIWPGGPNPRGATFDGEGVNFSIYSRVATRVEVCLFDAAGKETERFDLPEVHGFTWHGFAPGLKPGTLYGFRVHGPYQPEAGHRCNPHKLLVDPYAKALHGEVDWKAPVFAYKLGDEKEDLAFDDQDDAAGVPKAVVVEDAFDWGNDVLLDTAWRKTIIYELHVKGFTKLHPEVPEELRGTYAGLAHPAAIEHLRTLGVTAVELLPVHASANDAFLQEKYLSNYWGYNTLGYFAPEQRYGSKRTAPGAQVNEFKSMVKALHAAGIEVLLDVVYNHTCEGNHLGPTLFLKGIDNASYYWLMPDPRYYLDFSGTGNSLNASNPEAARLIVDSLRYWVSEMHVDGFRFDLAAVLGRTGQGEFDRNAPILQIINQDPVLSQVKLIAEPWDIGLGGYQVGSFPAPWREWNGKYRDAIRRYWKGDESLAGEIGNRLAGSADLYQGERRRPQASINFVTAHDGFTLHDLVTYGAKRNDANGEQNKDGADDNQSWNHGVEGETDDPGIVALRERQKRNLLATLFLSQGVPMLVAGDEMGRTQGGNNNAYCQDNEMSWVDWKLDDRRKRLLEFTRRMIAFRRRQPVLLRNQHFQGDFIWEEGGKDVTWYRPDGVEMTTDDWQQQFMRALAFSMAGDAIPGTDERGQRIEGDSLLILMNAHFEPVGFELPPGPMGDEWRLDIDTSDDARTGTNHSGRYEVAARTMVVLRQLHSAEVQTRSRPAISLDRLTPTEPGLVARVTQARRAGVLLPLFSLRTEKSWGVGDIGDIGPFSRWAGKAGFSLLQFLPVNEVNSGDGSPYAAVSAFALDPVFLAIDGLEDFQGAGGRKALPAELRQELEALAGEKLVQWPRVRALKSQVAHLAFQRFVTDEWNKKSRRAGDLTRFRTENRGWVEDYALYSALHRRFGKSWLAWPDQFRDRGHSALAAARRDHPDEILERIWLQWQLDLQWHKAKAEARDQGVALMGDLPFIVGLDSADVWSHPKDFRADLRVGAPPDPGHPEGQDWGLPAYNWDTLQRSELGWIRARAARARELFASYRVDHVVGFYRTYVRSPDGSAGFWPSHEAGQLGLGETILRAMRASGEVIAEDLGSVPPFLRPSLERLRVPGYKVLRWEKDGEAFRDPASWPRCSVATNATHDTDATADWYDNLPDEERAALLKVPGLEGLEKHPRFDDVVRDTLLALLYKAPSDLAIVPFQDALGHRERINQPGLVAESNWSYRMPMDLKTLESGPDAERLAKIAREAKRK